MDPKLQTSFIPKRNTGGRAPSVPVGFFTIFGYAIFGLSVLAAVGLYATNFVLEDSIKAKSVELDQKVSELQGIDALLDFNTRLKTVRSLLNSHLAVSKVFGLISSQTIQSVQFTSFMYTRDGEVVTVTLAGKAPNFASVALQSDTFSKVAYFKDQLFSNVALTQDGSVSFTFSAKINTRELSYIETIRATNPAETSSTPASDSLITN